ncbi:MAG: class I SAM-dependent methyltransferase [Gammaproteobacteria bacterium]
MTRGARFWNVIANRYGRKPVPDQALYDKKLAVSRRYMTPESAVFEFGCGTGTTALHHAPFVKNIVAIDYSERMIEIAESKRKAHHVTNVAFACGTLDDHEHVTAQYDVVLGLNVLHLLGNWKEAIAHAHRMLKPGGVFISSTACLGDTMAWLRYVLPLGRIVGLLPEIVVFTSAELKGTLASTGFQTVYEWEPDGNNGLFIVARRPIGPAPSPTPGRQ